MEAAQYEVRSAGTAVYIDRGPGHASRMPVTCRDCGARVGLTFTAQGEDAWITCSEGHRTQDWRLTPMAVRDVARAAADADVDVVPAGAEIWFRVRTRVPVLPEYEHMLPPDGPPR